MHKIDRIGAQKERKKPLKAVIAAAVFFALLSVSLSAAGTLKNLDYFRLKNIFCNGAGLIELSYLKGKNIFAIDLAKESMYISGLYPACRRIKLVRILPDTLYADFIKRKAIAYVRLYRDFCLDDGLVLFSAPREPRDPDLPVITGLGSKIPGVTSGKKYEVAGLALALNIIKERASNAGLKDYKISRIDITNSDNASFFVAQGLEIKIGAGNLKGKMNILSGILNQEESGAGNMKYIDFRFKEPVIKLKDK